MFQGCPVVQFMSDELVNLGLPEILRYNVILSSQCKMFNRRQHDLGGLFTVVPLFSFFLYLKLCYIVLLKMIHCSHQNSLLPIYQGLSNFHGESGIMIILSYNNTDSRMKTLTLSIARKLAITGGAI